MGMFRNAMTIDVEDYFHVSAFDGVIARDTWSQRDSRVERNTHRLLELFDDAAVSATFFFLGCVAEQFPKLVRAVQEEGHEIACHGYSHRLIFRQSRGEFRTETCRAKRILEDLTGEAVAGYRAASFSITQDSIWALDVLAEAGFTYDSSIAPVRHDIYGLSTARPYPHCIETMAGRSLVEFPPSTISIAGYRLPIGGGGYFRLFPYAFTRSCLDTINTTRGMPFTFYLHPWEIDPDQPRIDVGWKSRFRHYNNLHKCEQRLERLLRDFRFGTMSAVLESVELESVGLPDLLKRGPSPGNATC
jgi:polysaccharide deacetylase family protein (PEP-CTERM system associated)